MEKTKNEIVKSLEDLGNEKKTITPNPGFVEWLNETNQLSDNKKTGTTKKCKTGNCGNNKRTFIIVGVITFFIMWAGYGFFTFIQNIFK